jgi:hypothetical protein
MHGSGQGSSRAVPQASDEKEDDGIDEESKEYQNRVYEIMKSIRLNMEHIRDLVDNAIAEYPEFADQFGDVIGTMNRDYNKLLPMYNDLLRKTRRVISSDDADDFELASGELTDAFRLVLQRIAALKRIAAEERGRNQRYIPPNGPFYAAGAGKPKRK